MTRYPHVRVSGCASQRGRQYGEQARERVHRSISGYEKTFAHYAGWDWPTVTATARRFEPAIAAYRPSCLEEMSGIAEGAAVAYDDVLALNVRSEVMFAAKARHYAGRPQLPVECTAVATLPTASADGRTILAQNWDWVLHAFETVVVLESAPADGPSFVTVVEAGLLAKMGMNAAGVGLATNALVSDADAGRPGVPYHIVLRAILDSHSVGDAVDAIAQASRSSSANYLVADARGDAVDIEAAPGDASRVFRLAPEDGVLAHANHFCSPGFDGGDVSLWLNADSPFRLSRVLSAVGGEHGRPSVAGLRRVLADHANAPASVCCHPDPDLPAAERTATVASVIMDLEARTMLLADGNPCTSGYRSLDYAGFLAPPPG